MEVASLAGKVPPGAQDDLIDEDDVQEAWHTTLADPPNGGVVRDEVAALATAVLAP